MARTLCSQCRGPGFYPWLGPLRPLRGLPETRVAAREKGGVLGFPSRRGLTPRGPRRWQGWPGGHVRTPHIRSKWVSSAPRSPDSKAPTSGSCHIPRELTWPWATAGLAFSSWHTLPSPELHLAWVTLFPLRSSWFLPWPSPTLLRPEKAALFCSHRPHTVGNQL